ncbi:TPA: hypothetical protein ACK3Q6_003774 [Burkholderia cepacia]|jgi:hypothetical protein|uniref:Uncharacterized protein n=3 Tax=Burkholderia cepacia complex TaxID=87882 RepID=A0A250LLH0_9BURK|nr:MULTISPECIES: hypothetical protein [Burkholderia]HDV6371583.1 hypothetical protein [Burkholderia cepacia]KKL36301.1 hypothetical protein WR31_24090 [Burkholderia contaminans LMG 23361]MBA9833736.1 hypothetical protein [Burkholderia contaminans]MBA9842008.1 hypothetical protein [Burkholderia contaminans]MBA9866838.1 hypothetical protein [Burkholderia contaminans]
MHDDDAKRNDMNDDGVRDCIEYIVEFSGIRFEFVRVLMVLSTDLRNEIHFWGLEDPEIAAKVVDAVALHILDRPCATVRNADDFEVFVAELQSAARAMGLEVVETARKPGFVPVGGNSSSSVVQLHNTVILGGDQPSLMDRLTNQERADLFAWSTKQTPVQPSGSVNLMTWPGWSDVMKRLEGDSNEAWRVALDAVDRAKSAGDKEGE